MSYRLPSNHLLILLSFLTLQHQLPLPILLLLPLSAFLSYTSSSYLIIPFPENFVSPTASTLQQQCVKHNCNTHPHIFIINNEAQLMKMLDGIYLHSLWHCASSHHEFIFIMFIPLHFTLGSHCEDVMFFCFQVGSVCPQRRGNRDPQ